MTVTTWHMFYLLDEQSNPYPAPETDEGMLAAGSLLGDPEKRTVNRTKIQMGRHLIVVSTVFLVLNHAHDFGAPVLYETLVCVDDAAVDGSMRRYETRAQAEEGHEEVVAGAQEVVKVWLAMMNRLDEIDELPMLQAGEDLGSSE